MKLSIRPLRFSSWQAARRRLQLGALAPSGCPEAATALLAALLALNFATPSSMANRGRACGRVCA